MPVKTTVLEDDYLQILSNYDLGEYRGCQTFANGGAQTTVLLHTTKGKSVLKYYENRPQKYVMFEVPLFRFLRSNDYPIPALIKDRAGNLLGMHKKKPYIIFEFIEGEHGKNPNDAFQKEEAAEVVRMIALLHNLTKDRRLGFFHDRDVLDIAYCWREYQKIPRVKDKEVRENWFKRELSELEWPGTTPRGICHADLNYSNFLFRDGKAVAVLDFDLSFYSSLIYDIASLIYWWAWPPRKSLQEEAAAFLVTEYEKYRELTEEERMHIFDALKLIILLGIGWSPEDEFEGEKEKIELLNSIGRDGFSRAIALIPLPK